MLGAIAGDIIGSIYESHNIKSKDFPLFTKYNHFTDDTVLTVAIADSILNNENFAVKLKEYYHLYPHAGYGLFFNRWARSQSLKPYNSWGNGSAMRVSSVGFAFNSLAEVLEMAEKSAKVTHNHPEGIKGAQVTAACIFLGKNGKNKNEIKNYVETIFGYDLNEPITEIRKHYVFDSSCQGSVPQAIRAFLESEDFEDAIRLAISIGGDSDTIACITGGIAQAFYGGVPKEIQKSVFIYLDERLTNTTKKFCRKYKCF